MTSTANQTIARTVAPDARRATQRRAAGAVLVAGPAIYLLAEFVAAAAQTDPPYSYTYDYISNLGVRGPSEALGQVMNSPLSWVMNTGFFLFGITVFAGLLTLRGLRGRQRWAVLVPGALVAVGGILLAFFHGSAEAEKDGTGTYHGLGALAAIAGGNLLVIMLGRRHRLVGLSPNTGRAMTTLGVTGFAALVAFLAVTGSGAHGLIGLVERCAVYPFMISLIVAGSSIAGRRTLDTSAGRAAVLRRWVGRRRSRSAPTG